MKEQTFGAYLRKLRKSKKMSIQELADASGLSYSGISLIERNIRSVPKPSTIRLLAEGLKEPYEKLMEMAGYTGTDDDTEGYDYAKDPTISLELKELLDTLESLSPEDRALIINQAVAFAKRIQSS